MQVDSLDLRLAALHRQLLEFVPEICLDQQDVVPDPFRLVDHPLLLALAENVRGARS